MFGVISTFVVRKENDMTTEEIKKIVDEKRAGQLTVQLCRHWEVATERLESLVQDVTEGLDTSIEAELYAALMRMQSAVMALMELNKIPTTFLFSEYLERIGQTVSNTSMRQSVVKLGKWLMEEKAVESPKTSFFDMLIQMLTSDAALPQETFEATRQKVMPLDHIVSAFVQYLKPQDLNIVLPFVMNLKTEGETMSPQETADYTEKMRQSIDSLATMMSENLETMLIWLLILMLLPEMMVNMLQQKRTNSQAMAQIFNMVLVHARKSTSWWNYWNEHRQTLKTVHDGLDMKSIMKAEQANERQKLGEVPKGMFAKWANDREAFNAYFLDAHLSDDELRYFIFHLAALSEIARELDPKATFGEEQLVKNEEQSVGEAVLTAAHHLDNLVEKAWFPHYEAMWLELIQDETIFAHLKVTRKSPHNHLFTARFFCHLVGEMKKSAVFGAHSDADLAVKLTSKQYVGTFRKNIQEGMDSEDIKTQKIFHTIYQKHNNLAHPKK